MTYFVFIIISGVLATLGVDLSVQFTDFACLKSEGFDYAISRAYRSIGAVDLVGFDNLQRAKEAGMGGDVYFFPCKGKVSVQTQVDDFLDKYFGEFNRVWIDVEYNPSEGCKWEEKNYESNCVFLFSIVNYLEEKMIDVGIYSSKTQWTNIFGGPDKCKAFITLPLWYAHYDNLLSFSDFVPFGGWTVPSMKQYSGSAKKCGISLDLNYS